MWEYIRDGKFLKDLRFWGLLALSVIVITWNKSCNQQNELNKIPDLEYKEPERWEDNGKEHSEQITEDVSTDLISKLVDSLISDNKKLRNANLLLQETTIIDTIFREKLVYLDSVKGDFQIHKKDEWIDLSVRGNVRDKTSEIKLSIQDTLSLIVRENKRLFKSNQTLVDISHSNPYISTDKMRSFSVPTQKSIIVFGPSVGVGYTGTKIVPTIGISATFNVFSIKTQK